MRQLEFRIKRTPKAAEAISKVQTARYTADTLALEEKQAAWRRDLESLEALQQSRPLKPPGRR